MSKEKISWLFGAGVSKKFGGPLISDLNNFVLLGPEEGWLYRSQIKRYEYSYPEYIAFNSRSDNVNYQLNGMEYSLFDILIYINEIVEAYINEIKVNPVYKSDINYEDFLGLLLYLQEVLRRGDENIGLKELPFFFSKAKEMFDCDEKSFIIDLHDKVIDILIARIHLYLEKKINPYKKGELKFIEDILDTFEYGSILTLNNDLIIEQLLELNYLDYNDGFIEEIKLNDSFKTYRYDNRISSNRANFFKLHGSLDQITHLSQDSQISRSETFKFEYSELGSVLDYFRKPRENKLEYTFSNIIAGSSIKEKKYFSEHYFHVIRKAFYSLEEVNKLIVVGYGFGDKGINNFVLNWLNLDTVNKLFVIDPSPFINENVVISRWKKSKNLKHRVYIINEKIEDYRLEDFLILIEK